jgi:uridine kinase
MTNKKPLIIGVAGGSGSGKTTIVNRIIKELGDIRVLVVPHDQAIAEQNVNKEINDNQKKEGLGHERN